MTLRNILKFLAFFLFSIFLFFLVYRDQNWTQVIEIIRYDLDYTWIFVAIIFGMMSHVSRAMRWQLVAGSMGYRIRLYNGFMGVMIGYFANLAIPRMGEFTRCGVVSRYDKIPYAQLLGTIVVERVVDMLCLLLITGITFFLQFNEFIRFINENTAIREKIEQIIHSWWLIIILISVSFLSGGIWWLMKRMNIGGKFRQFVLGIKEGIISIRNMKQRWTFVFHSLFIWLMYFLMFYVNFFCFEFTSNLSVMAAMTAFVLGCYGMVAPVQNGMGAWHFMVIQGLLLYLPHTQENIAMTQTFALVAHGTMTLVYIIVGMACTIALPLVNTSYKSK